MLAYRAARVAPGDPRVGLLNAGAQRATKTRVLAEAVQTGRDNGRSLVDALAGRLSLVPALPLLELPMTALVACACSGVSGVCGAPTTACRTNADLVSVPVRSRERDAGRGLKPETFSFSIMAAESDEPRRRLRSRRHHDRRRDQPRVKTISLDQRSGRESLRWAAYGPARSDGADTVEEFCHSSPRRDGLGP